MKRDTFRQAAVIITTLYALVLNGLADTLPINGRNTAQISNSFKVDFVPAGYVFSIWGIIYIGLLAFTIYHSLPAQRANPRLRQIGWLVALSSLANGTWILFWHYGHITLTLLTMLVLLACLILIYLRLKIGQVKFTTAELWCVSIPVSVYLGWITVATIANVEDELANQGWNGFGISAVTWTVILLIVGVILAAVVAYTRRDMAYLLVLVWAFAGISANWPGKPVLDSAGFIAAGLVLVLLVASRLFLKRPTPSAA